jgi:hypothetical protein
MGWLAAAYVACAGLSGLLALSFSRLRSIQTASLFYLTVGLFFLLHALLGSTGREFALWPWIIVWGASLLTALVQFGREFNLEQHETPHE